MKDALLFSPLKIKNMRLRNRIVMCPMASNFAAINGEPSEQLLAWYEERAKGGTGLITVEATYVHDSGNSYVRALGASRDRMVPGLRRLADAAHRHGSAISLQLQHGGSAAMPERSGYPRYVVSYLPGMFPADELHIITPEDAAMLAQAWADAAARAKNAGFDAVELHGAHGYLIHQFLSPFTNKRSDEYGGSFENRSRFFLEVLTAVRKAVGPDFVVGARISAREGVEGGCPPEEMQELSRRLVDNGLDYLHVSVGSQLGRKTIIPPACVDKGWNADLAAEIRNAVAARVPVIVAGRNDATAGEKILREGKADLIAMGRPLVADPAMPNKMLQGRRDDVLECIACNDACIGRTSKGKTMGCALNPEAGREFHFASIPCARISKKVVVAGGGPGGMQAALSAAIRGHHVVLLEKDSQLGGMAKIAAIPPHKQDLYGYIHYLEEQLKKAGVDIRLNTKATSKIIMELQPDEVILATGAEPLIPAFCKAAGYTLTAPEVLKGAACGNSVLLIGGGLVGCETAEYLARQHKSVTIAEQLPEVAQEADARIRLFLLPRLEKLGVKVLTGTKVLSFENNGMVTVRVEPGYEKQIGPFDTVVIAAGMRPVADLMSDLEESGISWISIGDCLKPGRIFDAVSQAADVASAC